MPSRAHRRFHRPLIVSLSRRRFLDWLSLPALALALPGVAWAQAQRIASARLWPAQEYTRLILESRAPIASRLSTLQSPDRLVLELDGIADAGDLATLGARVQSSDPYLAAVRVGAQSPGALRVVLELKSPVAPQLFALPPVAEFGHRLVLDLYPVVPVDRLMALIEELDRQQAASRNPETSSSPPELARKPRQSGGRPIIVAIDPGHGGEDPGAIGRRGTLEKDVTLAIGRKLKLLLDRESGLKGVLTRDDDYFVPLAQRVQRARRVRADLFVSIHADAFREPRARGSSVFALSETGATSAAARWLAQKENAADLIGGVNLAVGDPVVARTLLDLSQTAQISDSLKVGRHVLQEIAEHNALHKPAVEQAGFAVLKSPDTPSILVETAFISNPDEEAKLRSDRHQFRFAESIGDGIRRYFASNPPLARTRS